MMNSKYTFQILENAWVITEVKPEKDLKNIFSEYPKHHHGLQYPFWKGILFLFYFDMQKILNVLNYDKEFLYPFF